MNAKIFAGNGLLILWTHPLSLSISLPLVIGRAEKRYLTVRFKMPAAITHEIEWDLEISHSNP